MYLTIAKATGERKPSIPVSNLYIKVVSQYLLLEFGFPNLAWDDSHRAKGGKV